MPPTRVALDRAPSLVDGGQPHAARFLRDTRILPRRFQCKQTPPPDESEEPILPSPPQVPVFNIVLACFPILFTAFLLFKLETLNRQHQFLRLDGPIDSYQAHARTHRARTHRPHAHRTHAHRTRHHTPKDAHAPTQARARPAARRTARRCATSRSRRLHVQRTRAHPDASGACRAPVSSSAAACSPCCAAISSLARKGPCCRSTSRRERATGAGEEDHHNGPTKAGNLE